MFKNWHINLKVDEIKFIIVLTEPKYAKTELQKNLKLIPKKIKLLTPKQTNRSNLSGKYW